MDLQTMIDKMQGNLDKILTEGERPDSRQVAYLSGYIKALQNIQVTGFATYYNGWTNYETWCVNLWLTNDQASYFTICSLPDAEAIKDYVDQLRCYEEVSGMFADLLTSALQSVNWHEIYDGLHEEDD